VASRGISLRLLGQDDVKRMLDKNSGRELKRRIRQGTRAGASLLVTPIRGEIKAAGLVRSGYLMKSVKTLSMRSGGFSVGPRAWYRPFVIRGTSRGIEPHPVVDRAVDAQKGNVERRVADVILRGKR